MNSRTVLLGGIMAMGYAAFAGEKVVVNGMKVVLPGRHVELNITPLPINDVHDETGVLPAQKPDWRDGFRLAKTAWIFQALIPGSVRVSVGKETFRENEDYLVNYNWGTLGRTAASRIPSSQVVTVSYRYAPESRIDLVQLTAGGQVAVKVGQPHARVPEAPSPDAGATPLFTVYLPHAAASGLSDKSILMIDPSVPRGTPVYDKEHLAAFRRRLWEGGPIKVVCLGDSITHGGDAGTNRYVMRLERYLAGAYPGRTEVINAGIGGNNSGDGLKRLEHDVLAKHPDLVIIMFGVNDENFDGAKNEVPVAEYRRNLGAMIEAIRAKCGASIILMTTSWKNPGWEHTRGNLDEYAETVRGMGREMNLCVVDNFTAWANLASQGIPYMTLLNSCINHPNGPAHAIFMDGLKDALEN